MKRLLSLFDYSGNWAWPFAQAGWDVIQWDIKLHDFMDINLFTDAGQVLEMFENVDGIIAAPPCTDFTVSGNQHWAKKDANGSTAQSLEMVFQVLRLANLFEPTDPDFDDVFFWAAENPVGRMARLAGLGDAYYFNPCDFAGWTNPTAIQKLELNRIRAKNGVGVTDDENNLVLQVNAYTKKTGLWGNFNRNLKRKYIEPVKTCAQGSPTQRLGGKSAKTKELRSHTPAGFAQAFFEANHNHQWQPSSEN
jgi:hypothetical protein